MIGYFFLFQEQDLTKEVPVKNNTIEELKAKLVTKDKIGKSSSFIQMKLIFFGKLNLFVYISILFVKVT